MFLEILILFVILLFLWLKYSASYWKRHGIDGPEPVLFFGNLYDYVVSKKKHFGEIYTEIYAAYPKARYVGVYKMQTPAILIRDLDLIKEILVTKFNIFNKNDFPLDPKLDPLLAKNPFMVPGDDWKKVRNQISPLFAQSRNKQATPYFNEIAKKLLAYIETVPNGELEAKDMCAKFATDIISAYAFGMDAECFTNPNSEFRQIGLNIFTPSFWNGIKQLIILFVPSLAKLLKVPFLSDEVDTKVRSIVSQAINERKTSKIQRNDLLQTLLEMQNKHGSDVYTEEVIAGHSLSFLTDGFETSATTMTFMLYRLALNPDIQRKAQAEVDAVFHESNGQITDEALAKLEYLEMILLETLRLHHAVFTMSKINLREYELPPQYITSTKSLKIEKETICIIPVYGLHKDPEYFPNPEKFDPERFSKENRDNIPKYAYQGFSEGPRVCPGRQYGVAKSKAGVATILSKYNLTTCSKTQVPIKINPDMFVLTAQNGVWIKLKKR